MLLELQLGSTGGCSCGEGLCVQAKYATRSYFTGTACDGTEYTDGEFRSWDGAGMVGQATSAVTVRSVGICRGSEYFRPESTGPTQLTVRFFGKAIRSKGMRGPYSVRAFHGHIKHPTAEPPEVLWARKDEPVLLPRAYDASEFADNEWSSPEKDAKIAQYAKMMEEL